MPNNLAVAEQVSRPKVTVTSTQAPRPFSTLHVKPYLWAAPEDVAILHREFLKLSRKFHPDLLVNVSEETRSLQEAAASQLNTDYAKLKDFWKLCESVTHGVSVPQRAQKPSTPPELAADYFELQELWDENPEKAQTAVRNFVAKVQGELESAEAKIKTFAARFPFQGLGDALAPWSTADLETLNGFLQKLRYYRSFTQDMARKFGSPH